MEEEFKLSTNRYVEIRSALSGFEVGQIYAAKQILSTLFKIGVSSDELFNYTNDMMVTTIATEKLAKGLGCGTKYSKPCPDCGGGTRVTPVNDSPRAMVGGGYHSVMYCIDSLDCGWEFYTKETEESLMAIRARSPKYVEDLKRLNKMRKIHVMIPEETKRDCVGCNK